MQTIDAMTVELRKLEDQRARLEGLFLDGSVGKNRKSHEWRLNEQAIGRINSRIHVLQWVLGDPNVKLPSELA